VSRLVLAAHGAPFRRAAQSLRKVCRPPRILPAPRHRLSQYGRVLSADRGHIRLPRRLSQRCASRFTSFLQLHGPGLGALYDGLRGLRRERFVGERARADASRLRASARPSARSSRARSRSSWISSLAAGLNNRFDSSGDDRESAFHSLSNGPEIGCNGSAALPVPGARSPAERLEGWASESGTKTSTGSHAEGSIRASALALRNRPDQSIRAATSTSAASSTASRRLRAAGHDQQLGIAVAFGSRSQIRLGNERHDRVHQAQVGIEHIDERPPRGFSRSAGGRLSSA